MRIVDERRRLIPITEPAAIIAIVYRHALDLSGGAESAPDAGGDL